MNLPDIKVYALNLHLKISPKYIGNRKNHSLMLWDFKLLDIRTKFNWEKGLIPGLELSPHTGFCTVDYEIAFHICHDIPIFWENLISWKIRNTSFAVENNFNGSVL